MSTTARPTQRCRCASTPGVPLAGDDRFRKLCCVAIVLQESADSFVADDGRVLVHRLRHRNDELVVEPLAIALELVVLDELADCTAKRALAEWHDMVQNTRI